MRFLLNRPDLDNQWLFDRCKEVEASPNGHLDLWAREHYKSTIITFAKTIQDILCSHGEDPPQDRECTIGIFSHTRPTAKAFLRQIKQEFETNEVLKELFPDILYSDPRKESPKWSEDEGICVKRVSNPKEATVEAWGLVDGQPTSKHFTHLIYDDVVTMESVTTPEMMKKTTGALENSYNLGAHGGIMRFIGTRYHFNDSYKTLMDRQTAIPRIHAATHDGTMTGEPVFLTKEQLVTKRRNQGPYTFACQMLLDPKGDETQGFKEEWLRYYEEQNRNGLNTYILFDPASGKKKDNDYTAAWVVGLGPDGKIRILAMVRDRLNLTERTRLLFKWHREYKPVRNGVRYEKYGMQADIEHIKSKMIEENYDFEITEVAGQTPKNDRIKRLIPYFEQGKILFPKTLHYTDYQKNTRDLVYDFIHEEYKPFPVPIHDDMLDALARLLEPDLDLIWPKEQTQQVYVPPMAHQGSTGWMG